MRAFQVDCVLQVSVVQTVRREHPLLQMQLQGLSLKSNGNANNANNDTNTNQIQIHQKNVPTLPAMLMIPMMMMKEDFTKR